MTAAPGDGRGDRGGGRGLVVVLVGAVDRRMMPALGLVPQLASSEARALHVCLDVDAARELATAWMDLGLDWLPLHIEDANGDDLATAVRRVIEREAATRSAVTVLIPEIDLCRWWQPLLHRATGRTIAWRLYGLRRVTTAVLPVPVDLAVPRHHVS
jgi:hypothetical protein